MSYDYRFINKQILPNGTHYTLLLEDTDGDGEESLRIEKKFNVDDKIIDSEFLRREAHIEIEKALVRELIEEQQEVEEVPPEEADSNG